MIIVEAERGMFEALRRAVVAANYLPDIQLSSNDAEWQTAREVWQTANPGRKIVDVFGIETPKKRGKLVANAIYINLEELEPGNIGMYGATFFELVSGTEGESNAVYNQMFYPNKPENGTFEIYYRVESVTQDRIIRQIIHDALGVDFKYIPGADDNGAQLDELMSLEGKGSIKARNDDNFERVYRYDVKDLWEEAADIKNTNLKAFSTARLEFEIEDSEGNVFDVENNMITEEIDKLITESGDNIILE